MKNNILTIAIPTFNRGAILDEALADLLPKIRNYNLEIVICDNASTDNTRMVVEKYMLDYPYIIYYRQEENIVDKNFITCYRLATSKYVWLLGDSSRIIEGKLESILELLTRGAFSAIIMNSHSRVKDVPSKVYNNPTNLLEEIGWHMGLISCAIVSKEMTGEEMIWRYRETTFIHLGLFFEYLCLNMNSNVYWLNENITTLTKLSRTSTTWLPRAFEIYGKGWMAFVLMLPSQISLASKLKCIKDHSSKQGFFEPRNLIALKSQGWLNYKQIKPYKNYMPFLTDTPPNVILLISLLPVAISKLTFKHYNSFHRLLVKIHLA